MPSDESSQVDSLFGVSPQRGERLDDHTAHGTYDSPSLNIGYHGGQSAGPPRHHHTAPPRLPADIMYGIAQLLWESDDASTIKSCTMVCREWSNVFQPFAFRTVTLETESHLYGLCDLLQDNPSISDMIRELHIHPLGSQYTIRTQSWIWDIPEELLRYLPKLHTLQISNLVDLELLNFDYESKPFFARFRQAFEGVTSLHLENCVLPLPAWSGFLFTLSRLERIYIADGYLELATGDRGAKLLAEENIPPFLAVPPGSTVPRLTSIHFEAALGSRFCLTRHFTNWLETAHPWFCLESLTLSITSIITLKTVGSVINLTGARLKRIGLIVGKPFDVDKEIAVRDNTFSRYINLSPCESLRCLRLSSEYGFTFVGVLATLPSRCLRAYSASATSWTRAERDMWPQPRGLTTSSMTEYWRTFKLDLHGEVLSIIKRCTRQDKRKWPSKSDSGYWRRVSAADEVEVQRLIWSVRQFTLDRDPSLLVEKAYPDLEDIWRSLEGRLPGRLKLGRDAPHTLANTTSWAKAPGVRDRGALSYWLARQSNLRWRIACDRNVSVHYDIPDLIRRDGYL